MERDIYNIVHVFTLRILTVKPFNLAAVELCELQPEIILALFIFAILL